MEEGGGKRTRAMDRKDAAGGANDELSVSRRRR
jgi:hypothetical protein